MSKDGAMNVELFDEKVMVFPEPDEVVSAGGIILALRKDKSFPSKGLVKLVGSGERVQKDIKEGDTVVFDKYAGEDVDFDGVMYRILERDDLMAVIRQ